MKSAYDQGVADALGSFGIREASIATHSRMPVGDMSLGAERFTKAIGMEPEEHYPSGGNPPKKNNVLEMGKASPAWSSPSSVEAGSYTSGFSSGIGSFGGV